MDAFDTTAAGNAGEEAVRSTLRALRGDTISGFIRTKNLVYFGKNFQLDFLVLVPKLGILVLEVKKWKGTIKATSQEEWVQELDFTTNRFRNASLQVLRTAGLLMQILEKERLNKWPIRPLVVFAHDSAKVLKANGHHSPQTDIIRRTMLPDWIAENSLDEVFYQFTEQEFESVKNAVVKYTSEYKAP
ncbi:NERD domain-containing protein [Niveibacterium sp. 24ML]|uniref:nuclease-related domain-containing protein n=1 Tax=Niveibacterium sp. 24ML TaxID=2985512 RepID=UPI00226D655F|nr:nuclease-related domain-containing protein [Niveibacterium sp. 24ML]MCX9158513.1 NERD domain-containing protein [Niveibacterium sp. 24ML]